MLTAWLLPVLVFAASASGDVLRDLLPVPQNVEIRPGAFACDLSRLDFVLKAPSKEAADALGDRLKEMQEWLGAPPKTHVSEFPVADTFALVMMSADGKAPAVAPPNLPAGAEAEGYELTVSDSGIVVSAKSERGLFYGMMTVGQLFTAMKPRHLESLPCVHIVDWPKLGMRGFHEDYGRDQLPTVEDHKRTVRTLAQYKMNTHLWFIEPDHFVYAFDPEIGKDFDRFTFDEIREVVAYAKKYYVEVIPVVESLAHMENTLTNPKYADLAEVKGSGVLCPTSDESFALIRNILNEIAAAFDGRYFHCGLDESVAVGQGKSADAVKTKGIEKVYADYYTRLDDLVKSHGKTMMMYADIVLNHPKVMDLLPKDIVMMYWNYSDAPHHPGFDTLAKSGFKTVSLSATWDWVNLYPIYSYAFRNIERLAAQTAELGSLGTFTANWGDGNLGAAGANLSEMNYYGVVHCGAQGWRPQPMPIDEFSRVFAEQFFGAGSDLAGQALTLLAKCQGDDLARNTQARMMFHSAPAEQIPKMAQASKEDLDFWRALKDDAGKAHDLIRKTSAKHNADFLRSCDLAARELELAGEPALQYRATAEALRTPGFDGEKQAQIYEQLAARHQALWREYETIYRATNRPINLRYLVLAWDKSKKDLTEFAAKLRSGEAAKPAAAKG